MAKNTGDSRRAPSRWGALLRLLAVLVLPGAALAADPQLTAWTIAPLVVPACGSFSFTLGINNTAVDAANNARLSLTVPSGAVFVSATPASQNCALAAGSSTTVLCILGTLRANGSDPRSVVMTWRATVAGPAVITANSLLTADNDTTPANNTDNRAVTVIEGANLALAKACTPNPVIGGANVT